jgi:hypothetical protein
MSKWELFLNGYRVSVCEDEKVLDVEGGEDSTTMAMYLMLQN